MVRNKKRIPEHRYKIAVDWEQGMHKCSFIWKKTFIIFNRRIVRSTVLEQAVKMVFG